MCLVLDDNPKTSGSRDHGRPRWPRTWCRACRRPGSASRRWADLLVTQGRRAPRRCSRPSSAPRAARRRAPTRCAGGTPSARRSGEPVLHRDEVLHRVADEGDEEQPGVEPTESGGAVGEVVAPAQQLRTVVRASGGPAARARRGRSGDPRPPAPRNRARLNSAPPRAVPLHPLPPMIDSCSCMEVRSQVSMCMLIRRATRKEPSTSQRRPPASPSPDPDELLEGRRVSAFRLAVPSLNPIRLRAVTCSAEVEEVRPKPSCAQRTATEPNPSRARLRIAWTATWGSSAQA